jgi:hypothetical protein
VPEADNLLPSCAVVTKSRNHNFVEPSGAVQACNETALPFNTLTPKDHYNGSTAPLTYKRCILYIYSTNIGTEYFEHGIFSSFFFFFLNAVCFIILTYLVPVLFTFYIQGVQNKIIPAPKGSSNQEIFRILCNRKIQYRVHNPVERPWKVMCGGLDVVRL